MVEVDLFIVIIAAVSIVGLLIVTFTLQRLFRKGKTNHAHKSQRKKKTKETPITEEATVAPTKKIVEVKKKAQKQEIKVKLEKTATKIVNPITDESENDTDEVVPIKPKESSNQKAARVERQKIVKAKKTTVSESGINTTTTSVIETNVVAASLTPAAPPRIAHAADGWAVVEDKRRLKPKKVVPKAEAVKSSVDAQKSQISVDAKKIGVIIGPKGVTLRSIQEATGVEVNVPKSDRATTGPVLVALSGTSEGIKLATKIITELSTKGFSPTIEGEDFQESSISVHPMYLPDIIGKNGVSIRALQDNLGVKVIIPEGAGKDDKPKVKIGIAGTREKVAAAKEVIKEITEVYHSSITHPNITHVEIDVPERLYNFIIGPKGSEIHHIQNNFKVSVHIPNINSVNRNVLVVGGADGVAQAEKYICKIVSQAGAQESASNVTIVEDWRDGGNLKEEVAEDWAKEYTYNRQSSNVESEVLGSSAVPLSAVVSAGGALNGAIKTNPTATTTMGWNTVVTAEGW